MTQMTRIIQITRPGCNAENNRLCQISKLLLSELILSNWYTYILFVHMYQNVNFNTSVCFRCSLQLAKPNSHVLYDYFTGVFILYSKHSTGVTYGVRNYVCVGETTIHCVNWVDMYFLAYPIHINVTIKLSISLCI